MEARNRVGIGLSYRPARLHRLAESIPWFLKSLKYHLLTVIGVKGGGGLASGTFHQRQH
jgi:hypothetical protein